MEGRDRDNSEGLEIMREGGMIGWDKREGGIRGGLDGGFRGKGQFEWRDDWGGDGEGGGRDGREKRWREKKGIRGRDEREGGKGELFEGG